MALKSFYQPKNTLRTNNVNDNECIYHKEIKMKCPLLWPSYHDLNPIDCLLKNANVETLPVRGILVYEHHGWETRHQFGPHCFIF